MYISTRERACILVVSAVSFFSSPFFSSIFFFFSSSSSCLSLLRVVRLIIAVMPRGVKVYTIRPLIVDSSTSHSILPNRRSPLSHGVDGMERKPVPLPDYDIVINRYHRVREAVTNPYCCERFYARFFSVNFYSFNRKSIQSVQRAFFA